MKPIRAVIFDMDGLLIDSEPFWQDAELACFQPLGVPITRDICRESAGRRIDEVVRLWHERFGWEGPGIEEMVERVLKEVTRLIMTRSEPLPGVYATMDAIKARSIPMAIASSSPPQLIEAVVSKLELGPYLSLTHSGIHEERGKPDPAVFLTTANKLGVAPERCLVFEDAPAGVTAAHRAGMHVVAVPSVFDPADPAFEMADEVLGSLVEFSPDRWF
ncbi:MAG: hexitol phosphatase HxpB [Wenzhouxiangella sp.]|jgi:sugar-phosphatase|nr:hexitol phosphatase HxpB [Wenzhouxiangella sp.]